MAKRLNLVHAGFIRRTDMDFSDDGSRFIGYEYNGVPITYCKDGDMCYISIDKSDLGDQMFTWDDWRTTEEAALEDEFNGVTTEEVDLEKLKSNCMAVLKKFNEMNSAVKNEKVDPEPVISQLREEIDMANKFAEEFKNKFEWYKCTSYELSRAYDYFNSLLRNIKSMENMLVNLISGKTDIRRLREMKQHLEKYGYVELKSEDFYITELSKYI